LIEHKISDLKVVTYKEVATLFSVSKRKASYLIANTKLCYNKPRNEAITLGQLLKANNLEK